jgi:hypothetical protein
LQVIEFDPGLNEKASVRRSLFTRPAKRSETPSGDWLQTSLVIPELGFCLGTRAQMLWLEDGHPIALVTRQATAHSLFSTLALRDGAPYFAWARAACSAMPPASELT